MSSSIFAAGWGLNYCVNFQGDGFPAYRQTREGNRIGEADEAADWVSYANDPDNRERKSHGHPDPYHIKLWQLGNETRGGGGFSKDQSIRATIEFAKAMRARDSKITLIGWGDSGWASELITRCGDQIDYVAIHMMGQSPLRKETILNGFEYQQAPERAWEELMEMIPARIEKKLLALEEELDAAKSKLPIAITEGHLSLPPSNSNPILTERLTGVYGARVRICTAADFNGTRWTTNAVIHQMPRGMTYALPAGAVMRLFKQHIGTRSVEVKNAPSSLDIAASRSGDKVFLHVANMNYSNPTPVTFGVAGMVIEGGRGSRNLRLRRRGCS